MFKNLFGFTKQTTIETQNQEEKNDEDVIEMPVEDLKRSELPSDTD